MNVQQLRTFITVTERGSFSEAARELGVSQPAITMQVQALETAVGATLLDRRYRRVDLTEAGRLLLPHARQVLEQIAAAQEEITSLSGAVTGRLTIAASTTPGVYVIPRLLGPFLAKNPEVGVTITVGDTASVVDAVEEGRAQFGVTGGVVRGARVGFEQLGTDELVVVAAPGSEFAGRTGVHLRELSEAQWIMRESGSGTRQVTESLLGEHGLDVDGLRIVVELGTGEAIVSAIEGGLGVAVLSRHVASKALKLGAVVELDAVGFPATRPFYAVTPRGTLTRAAQAFSDTLWSALR